MPPCGAGSRCSCKKLPVTTTKPPRRSDLIPRHKSRKARIAAGCLRHAPGGLYSYQRVWSCRLCGETSAVTAEAAIRGGLPNGRTSMQQTDRDRVISVTQRSSWEWAKLIRKLPVRARRVHCVIAGLEDWDKQCELSPSTSPLR